tara:strand:+ start:5517 stop:5963 length:447 start_codon:yes stop_codon:yes gene_type:complete
LINILKNFFENNEVNNVSAYNELELICGLLIEAANTDGNIDDEEISKIEDTLTNLFEENNDEVKSILQKAIKDRNNSKSLFYYTSKINKDYSEEKKILLLEILWEIVLADGKLHDYETSLLRRLSGLLYISDIKSGNARKRALIKISK